MVVDLRRGSPTFGEWEAFELDDANRHQLWIPIGFGHGFCVLSETADFVYKCTTYYDPATEAGIRFDDPDVGIQWPANVRAALLRARPDRAAAVRGRRGAAVPVLGVSGHDGRYAPSPTGTLHLGNLRTALLAWLFARSGGGRFLVRMEDLDEGRVRAGIAEQQLDDLRCDRPRLGRPGRVPVRTGARATPTRSSACAPRAGSTSASARAPRSARPRRRRTGRCPRASTRAPACG